MDSAGGPRFIDLGTAPEFFANGLFDVEVMGSVSRFVLYVERKADDGTTIRVPPFTCIMPNDAIGPAIALTIKRLGSGLIVPAVSFAARSLIRSH